MNDLISGLFSPGRNSESPEHVIEMGTATTLNLNKFFQDVEMVQEDLRDLERLRDSLQESHERSKTAHTAKAVRDLRATMDIAVAASLKKAKAIKSRLEVLDRDNASSRSVAGYGPGSSSDRTRTSVVNGLRKQLKDSVDKFNDLRDMISSAYRETVQRRYFTITGEAADDNTVNRLISTGESEVMLQKAIQEQGRGSIMEAIHEIQERHSAVRDLEKSLKELHQVFMDMAVLVEAQGDQLDDIESNLQRASSYVRGGAEKLQSARNYQKNTHKWAFLVILILLIVIIVVVLLIVKPWQ